MSVTDQLLENNEKYAAGFDGPLPLPPAKHVAVLACMDARINVYGVLGLEEGEAHVIRNAGGSAKEALRSLVISERLLGTTAVAVIKHTDCGMLTFTNADLHERLGPESESIDFEPFPDVAERVRQSVETIRSHPLLPDTFGATGFVYDERTGRIEPV
jgi:carbonic anhydrase